MQTRTKKRFLSKKRSFLFTLAISIILLICIPLIAIQLLLVQQSIEEIKTNHTESYISALQNNAYSFNSQIELMNSHALKISNDLMISKLLKENASGYDIFLAAQSIKDYTIALPSIEGTCVYYPSKKSVLTEGYLRTLEMFYDIAGASDPLEQQRLKNFLDGLDTMQTHFVGSVADKRKLLVARPIHLGDVSRYDSAVIFIIDLNDLMDTFRVNLPSGAQMAVFNAKTQWLFYDTKFPTAECETENFQQFLENSQQHYYELTTPRGHYEIYKYVDYKTGNVYLSSMNKEDAQRQLTVYVEHITDIMILSSFLLAMFFGFVVYINYKPIHKLMKRHSVMVGRSNISELELLDSAFFARDEKIANQRSLLAGFVLGDLIYGTHVEEELLDKQFDRERLRFFSVATVVALEMSTGQSNAVAEELWKNLDNTQVYTTGMPNRPHVLFVWMSEKPLDEMLIKVNTVMAIRSVMNCDAVVRVGRTVHNLEDIRESYYSSFLEESRETNVKEIVSGEAYPAQEVQYFIQRACLGDEEEALRSLEKIEVIFALRKYPPTYRQYYCYKLLISFLTGLRENQITVTPEQTEALMAFRNLPKLFALLRETTSECCNQVETVEENSNAQLQKRLLEYVEENLHNCELCLTSAADWLNISTYAVSRLFKECTGMGFKEYVTAKRLDQAYKLLKSTSDSISDIAKAVGIDNTKYFFTLFKKHYGQSPQQMRGKD